MIQIDERWNDLISELKRCKAGKLVYAVGASDRGKTTFCRYLADALSKGGLTAYIDCDPGQSFIGPPTTIGLQAVGSEVPEDYSPLLYFTGALSPKGHLLQNLTGIKKLAQKAATLGFQSIILDSSGFISGSIAQEFQFQVIDLLQPGYLVAFQYEEELEGLLRNFAGYPGMNIIRMPVSAAVQARSVRERYQYRTERFKEYFKGSRLHELLLSETGQHGMIPDYTRPDTFDNLLVGLCDPENLTLAVGIVRAYNGEDAILTVCAPLSDISAVRTIRFGSVYLNTRDFKTSSAPFRQ